MNASDDIRVTLSELIEMRHRVREVQLFSTPGQRSPLVGLHHSKLRGRGVDFDQVRVYQAGDDVRVNGVAPGAVLWPEAGKDEAERAHLVARTPLARIGTPADVAGAVLWLLRDAPYVTGEILRVDGGRAIAS